MRYFQTNKNITRLWLVLLCLFLTPQMVWSAACPSDFGVFSRGTLTIGTGVTLNGVSVPSNSGGNVDGILPGNPVVLENQNPQFSLPALNPTNFPANNSTVNTSANTISAGAYNEITVSNSSTTTFTGGTYNIDKLVVGDDATIVLAPGIYYIDTLEMGTNSNLVISPAGSVQIFVNNEVKLKDDVNINNSGNAANLTFRFYNNVDMEAEDQVTFVGTIYSPYNSSDVKFGNNAQITGGIITNGKVDIGKNTSLTYGASEQAATLNVVPCVGSLHHIEISHDGTALTCEPEAVTFRACANADCTSLYTNDVSVTLSPAGWVGGNTQTIINGSSIFQLRHTTAETVTLAVSSSSPTAPSQCTTTCDLTFFETGFTYSIPTQTSCVNSATITISAVSGAGLNPSQACVPIFVGQLRNVSFSLDYINPTSGTRDLTLNYSGTNYTPINSTSSKTVLISFDGSGQATFTVTYPDAGRISLNSQYTGSVSTGDDGLSMSGAATFVTRPARLYVYSDDANSECSGSVPSCSAFRRAGENFNLKIRGACADNSVTPNFQLSGLTLTHINIAPTISQGTLAVSSFDITAADGGDHVINNQTVSEVGSFTFTATLPAGGYFGETIGNTTLNTSNEIGRFYPDHFCLAANTISNRTDINTVASCTDNFSFLDEDFDALFTLTAQAMGSNCASADITRNYSGVWSMFSLPFNEDTTNPNEIGKLNLGAVNDPAGTPAILNSRIEINTTGSSPVTGQFNAGQLNVTTKLDINRSGFGPDYTPEAPLTDVRIGVNPIDSDNVMIDSTQLTLGIAGNNYAQVGSTQLFFGRLFADNAYGTNDPATPLQMWAQSQYCNIVSASSCSDWQSKTNDSCSLYSISAPTDTIIGGVIPGDGLGYYKRASATVASSVFDFLANIGRVHVPDTNGHSAGWQFFYTAGGTGGDYVIPFSTHPYLLNYDATASFGLYRGDDRIIYWREILE